MNLPSWFSGTKTKLTAVKYVFGEILHYDKTIVVVFIISALINPLLVGIEVYIPSIIVSIAIKTIAFKKAIISLCVLCMILVVLHLSYTLLKTLYNYKSGLVRTDLFENLLLIKRFRMKYALSESPQIGKELEKAKLLTWSSNVGVEATLNSFQELVQNIIVFGEMVFICVSINPIIPICLAIFTGIEFLFESKIKKEKNRIIENELADQRKLNYYIDSFGDPSKGKEMRTYSVKEWLKSKYKQTLKSLFSYERMMQTQQLKLKVLTSLDSCLCLLLIYSILIGYALMNRIDAASFILLLGAATETSNSLRKGIINITDLYHYTSCFESFQTIMELPEDTRLLDDKDESIVEPLSVEFKNVSFCYPGSTSNCIDNLSFYIKPGEKIGIVGPNGAGKTTLVKLLIGLIDPSTGEILIQGKPLSEYPSLQPLFSVVFQEINQYAFTINENISFTDNFDEPKLSNAIQSANLEKDFALLRKKGETHLRKDYFEDGISLSGGQIQKLALARALYKQAPILLLDEPTNSLDPLAEATIYESYQAITDKKTAFFISHRLNSTVFCDRILYIENGSIVEQGSPKELLTANGKYASMFRMQMKGIVENEFSSHIEK